MPVMLSVDPGQTGACVGGLHADFGHGSALTNRCTASLVFLQTTTVIVHEVELTFFVPMFSGEFDNPIVCVCGLPLPLPSHAVFVWLPEQFERHRHPPFPMLPFVSVYTCPPPLPPSPLLMTLTPYNPMLPFVLVSM